MKLSILVIFGALLASACTGGDRGVSETVASSVPTTKTTATAPTTTTVSTTTSTVSGSEFGLGQTEYVLAAGGEIQSVSPDGRVMVLADGEHVGLQELDGSDTERVASVSSPPEFRLRRLVGGWTPDGSIVAFHDRTSTAATFDSTVWVLDTREPALQLLITEQAIIVFDVAVAPDGEVIAFSGSLGSGPDRVDGIFTVQGSNEPVLLAEFNAQVIAWSPDGTALFVTGFPSEEAGLWKVDRNNGELELLSPVDDALGQPDLVALSADGGLALVYYRSYVAREFPANVSHYGVVQLETGQVFPLKEPAERDFFGPTLAAFSPGGTWVAFIYHDGEDRDAPLVLAIRPMDGGEEQIINGDLYQAVGSPPTPHSLFLDPDLFAVWATEDRLVFPTRAWALVINLE